MRFPTFASNKKTLASKLCSLIALCDSDIYLTTSFRHCQELFSFSSINTLLRMNYNIFQMTTYVIKKDFAFTELLLERLSLSSRSFFASLRQRNLYYHCNRHLSTLFFIFSDFLFCSEYSVSCIPKSRTYICVRIEFPVKMTYIYLNIRMCFMQRSYTFRCCNNT